MKKYLIFIMILLVSCQNKLERENSNALKMDFILVKRIINSYDSLNSIILDSNYSLWKPEYTNSNLMEIEKLKSHIITNHFTDGYDFEKETIDSTNQMNFSTMTVKTYFWHNLKVRSKATGEIIWFYFSNMNGNTKEGGWKFGQFSFCNNPEYKFSGDEPCDKK